MVNYVWELRQKLWIYLWYKYFFDNEIYLKIKKEEPASYAKKFKQDQEHFFFFIKLSRV